MRKQQLTSLCRGAVMSLALTAAAFSPWHTAQADELLLNENFEYLTGDLYGQGGWLKYGSNPEAPIQVVAGSLTYQGYMNDAVGNKAALTQTPLAQDLFKTFDNDHKVSTGTLYSSFLINVSDPNNSKVYFFSMFAQTKAGMVDGKGSTEVAKVWLTAGSDANHFKLAICRSGAIAKSVSTDEEFEVGKTYLIVVGYEFVDGVTNDKCYLWVNPDTNLTSAPEPTIANSQELESTASEASTSYGGLMGVELRQGATGSNNAPDLTIDALRAATSWADLFPEQGSGPVVTTPSLTLSAPTARLGSMFPETTATTTVYIGGKNLTEDVTVTCPEGVTCNHDVLTADQLTADEAVELVFTVTAPTQGGEFTKNVTFTSPETADLTFSIQGEVVAVTDLPNSTQVMSQFEDGRYEGVTYRYTGKAVVTYIEKYKPTYGDVAYKIYAQDMFGGLMFDTDYTGQELCSVAVGDEISNVVFYIDSFLGAPVLAAIPVDYEGNFCTVTANDKSKTPSDVTIGDITSTTASTYIYRLVKLTGVTFADAQGKFEANKNYTVTDGEKTAIVRLFEGSDLVDTDIPTGSVSITGLSAAMNSFTLKPRSKADIEAGAPAVEISREFTFDFANDAAPINSETEIAKYTVKAENLPVPVPILITGGDSRVFKLQPESLPAGTSTTVVSVIYAPDEVGMHKGGIMFDFDAVNPEFNYTSQFNTCKAYDPEHLPTVSITPAVIEIEATPGNPVTATAVLDSENAFDYITASRSGSGDNGGITINNTYLPANSKNVVITVTFSPKAQGEFSDTWTFTTTKCATPATLTVKAKCTEPAPVEPTEGDTELKANFASPFPWYVESFSGVTQNKPLSLSGWTNIAVEGTRAWWGYTGANGDEFTAAKVTAYDSTMQPGQGTECEMSLVSPALDYKNAPYKNLRFRLMGMYLNENSGDELTVQFGEQVTDEDGQTTVEFYDMSGFNIPSTADEAGEWIEYDVDMSVIEDMPDAFVIAFVFSGTRGADNTTTYYITDFTWGRQADAVDAVQADGLTPDADGYYTLYNIQGMRVIRTRDISDINNLPKGLYIGNGRKVLVK